jgi:hypothetical protein
MPSEQHQVSAAFSALTTEFDDVEAIAIGPFGNEFPEDGLRIRAVAIPVSAREPPGPFKSRGKAVLDARGRVRFADENASVARPRICSTSS